MICFWTNELPNSILMTVVRICGLHYTEYEYKFKPINKIVICQKYILERNQKLLVA